MAQTKESAIWSKSGEIWSNLIKFDQIWSNLAVSESIPKSIAKSIQKSLFLETEKYWFREYWLESIVDAQGIAAWMQPPQYDLRNPAAKYKCSRGTEQPWRSHYDAICGEWVANHNRTMRNDVGNLQLQNRMDLDATAKKRRFWWIFKRNI